jgi:hypothetical protein
VIESCLTRIQIDPHMQLSLNSIILILPMLVTANASLLDECTLDSNYMSETSAGSSLLQGLSQQSQLLEMSVDPEGDGLTQEHAQKAHTIKSQAKQPYTLSQSYGHAKKSSGASAQHGVRRNGKWSSQHAKKVPAKQPSFSAHFRIAGTGEGVPEKVKGSSREEELHGQQTQDNEAASARVSMFEHLEERIPEPSHPDEEKEPKQDSASPIHPEQSTQGSETGEAWTESQDAKMEAAVSLAKALLSLQVTPPEFIENKLESADQRKLDQRKLESKGHVGTAKTTNIVSRGMLPDHSQHSNHSLPGKRTDAGPALLETFRSQLHDNFTCLLMTVVNGPLQTLAIIVLLFLGYTLQREILELKASNAELMQKISDMTTAPPTPRSDRRFCGRADSRADWLRAIEAVGGRE